MLRGDEFLEPQAFMHCIRNLVALSTLPVIWKEYNARQIADSVAAALISMLKADVIYVSVPGLRDDEADVDVFLASPAVPAGSSGHVEHILRGALIGIGEQTVAIDNPSGSGAFHIAAVPMGLGRDAGIVVGALDRHFPSETHRLLLRLAANHATLAIQRYQGEARQRRMVSVTERSSEFGGFARLEHRTEKWEPVFGEIRCKNRKLAHRTAYDFQSDAVEGAMQYLNKAGCDLLGLSDIEEARRLNVFDFLAPDERSRALYALMPLVMETGRWLGELNFHDFTTRDDVLFLLDWFRIDDLRTGHPMNMATVSRDLRGQKRLEENLRRLNESLEQRVSERTSELAEALERLTLEAKERQRADVRAQELQLELLHASRLSAAGQMAGALAHELNQPLTAFTNSVNAGRRMLAKDAYRIEIVREVLDEAADQALRAGEIIRRLREFVTRGEAESRMENLPALIREASDLAVVGARLHDVQIRLDFDPNAKAVRCSKIQLQQVMVNLIRNAHEALAESGQRDLVVTTSRLDDESIEIAVADRGSGVPDDLLEHLFEPFFTTKSDGMGLGLSICRSIVEAHGGRLRYEANRGGGAVFRVTLPAPTER